MFRVHSDLSAAKFLIGRLRKGHILKRRILIWHVFKIPKKGKAEPTAPLQITSSHFARMIGVVVGGIFFLGFFCVLLQLLLVFFPVDLSGRRISFLFSTFSSPPSLSSLFLIPSSRTFSASTNWSLLFLLHLSDLPASVSLSFLLICSSYSYSVPIPISRRLFLRPAHLFLNRSILLLAASF